MLNNLKKVVSYGGWLAIKGLPLHWWTSHFFKQIGDVCGGLIEPDKRTEKREYLYDARIKVRNNKSGFLLELVKLTQGEQSYFVYIQPLSPAIQPPNISSSQFLILDSGKLMEFPTNFMKPRNQVDGDQKWVTVGSVPVSLKSPVRFLSSSERTDSNVDRGKRQKCAAGTNDVLLEVEKMPLELKRVTAKDNFLEGVLGALNEKEAKTLVEFRKLMTFKRGPPIFEKRRISRRLNERNLGNIIKTPGLIEPQLLGPNFLLNMDKALETNLRVLNPIDFGAQKERNAAKSSGQSVYVLKAGLEDQEIEETEEEDEETPLKLKNEVQLGKEIRGMKDGLKNFDLELQKEEGD